MEGIFGGAVVIVDGYAHCGIRKYQPVEVVLDTMAHAGVDRAVLCQHLFARQIFTARKFVLAAIYTSLDSVEKRVSLSAFHITST